MPMRTMSVVSRRRCRRQVTVQGGGDEPRRRRLPIATASIKRDCILDGKEEVRLKEERTRGTLVVLNATLVSAACITPLVLDERCAVLMSGFFSANSSSIRASELTVVEALARFTPRSREG